jgi:hypothetical protein
VAFSAGGDGGRKSPKHLAAQSNCGIFQRRWSAAINWPRVSKPKIFAFRWIGQFLDGN